ncbi:NADP-dependent oxidoreductase [Lysinimonas soli]|uniref:NADP-dependent oxidoreductase n=1 Tax=Lysinimonas soli TaxID=1074233 RepID=A0ABW0NQC8_9MICO
MIAVTVTTPAGPDSIEVRELPDPSPAAGELLIATEAATLNPADNAVVSGAATSRFPTGARPPYVPGWDLAGTVTAVGEGVDAALVGRRVLGFSPWFRTARGTQAGLVALPLDQVAVASGTIPASELTTFGLIGLTALHLLRAAGDARSVLVTAAAGGVGRLTVELAVHAGLDVIATAAEKDRAELTALGVRFIPREVDDLAAAVRELVPGGVDAVLNTAPGTAPGIAAVRDGGRYRSVTVLPDAERGIDVARVGVTVDGPGLIEIVRLAESGEITTRVAQTFPVARAADAYRALNDRSSGRGKIVLTW